MPQSLTQLSVNLTHKPKLVNYLLSLLEMEEHKNFKYSTGVIAYPITFILIIWLVFWVEVRFGFNFTTLGIYPRTLTGLKGIFLSAFVHGDLEHLYHNTIPLFVLSTALFYFYRSVAWKVMFWGIVLSGFLTWCIGRPSFHIGASGLIYVLVSFTFFKGIFTKHYRLIALSLLVVFLYGSMIWYTLPIDTQISWEGHLSGLIVGFLFALIFKKAIAKPQKYAWQQENYNEDDDPFLRHFDEDGNFIESKNGESTQQETTVNYVYNEKKD